MRDVFIYALCNPDKATVFYVGITVDVNKRLKQHLWDSKKMQTPLHKYIQSMKCVPKILIIKKVELGSDNAQNTRYANLLEKYYILKYKINGHKLLNINHTN